MEKIKLEDVKTDVLDSMINKNLKPTFNELVCARYGCENTFKIPTTTLQYYCSKKCRYLARGSKKGKKIAAKMV